MTATKYILIQNEGEIESNSFELIGASTKRNDSGKIGFFGSGLKYSIAYMMRNNIGFRIFSGLKELVFSTKEEKLKNQDFDRICINDCPTSYTTTMGPTWKEDWFVIREIYCNALDEGSCNFIKEIENVSPSEGKTRIYIELTPKLKDVILEWDKYFSEDRDILFASEKIYTSALGNEDGSVNHSNYQPVKILAHTEGVIYRRGVRVGKVDKALFDYDFKYVNINEDRTMRNQHSLSYAITDLMGSFVHEDFVTTVLRTSRDDKNSFEYGAIIGNRPDQKFSSKWVDFSNRYLLVIKEISGRYAEQINTSKKEVFLMPSYFSRELKKQLPDVALLGMGNVIGDTFLSEVEKTPKMNFLLKEVINSLKEMSYEVGYDIKVVEFENENILGQADLKSKQIFIASKTFDLGRREIAMTLMEENEHIKSQCSDETRAFQTHIFSQWLKTMEEKNGLFL